MKKISDSQLREYGRQESSFVLANIFNPNASGYNNLEMIENIAQNACTQAESAFGKNDPIHIEALLNLALFYLRRTKDQAKATVSLDKATSILSVNYEGKEDLLAELLAIKVLVELLDDHAEEKLFVIDIMVNLFEQPFGICENKSDHEKAVDVFKKMIKIGLNSQHDVLGYMISEIGQPLAEQLSFAGFRKAAIETLNILSPLIEKVWEPQSKQVHLLNQKVIWLSESGVDDIEMKHQLKELGIHLKMVIQKEFNGSEIPIQFSKIYGLFKKAKASKERIIVTSIEEQFKVIDEAIRLFNEVLNEIEKAGLTSGLSNASELIKFQVKTYLGCLYMAKLEPDRALYIEESIKNFKEALEIYYNDSSQIASTPSSIVHERIRVLLAYAYNARIQGDPEENVNQILVYTDSLEIEKDKDPYYWALGKYLRAISFYLRKETKLFPGAKADESMLLMDNMIALNFLKESKEVFNENKFPYESSRGLFAWILIISSVISKDASEDMRRIFYQHLEAAEEIFTPETHPSNWCKIQIEKAKLAKINEGKKNRNLPEKPLYILFRAQAFLTKQLFTKEWGLLELEKARILAMADNAGNRKHAIKHYKNSLMVFKSPQCRDRFTVLNELGNFLFRDGKFEEAVTPLCESFELGEHYFEHCESMQARRVAILFMEGLSRKLSYCYFRLNRLDEAVISFDQGKSILLYDNLKLRFAKLDSLEKENKLKAEKLIEQIKYLESDGYGGMGAIEDMEELINARHELKNLIPNYGFQINKNNILGLSNIPKDSAIVMPLITEHGSVVYILTSGLTSMTDLHIIPFPLLTSEVIKQWLFDSESGWFVAYKNRNEMLTGSKAFENTIILTCNSIWTSFLQEICKRLSDFKVSEIIFMPSEGLQFLPISAAGNYIEANSENGNLIDNFQIRIAPSASILSLLASCNNQSDKGKAVIVGVSEYEELSPLPNAKEEVKAIAQKFGVAPILDNELILSDLASQFLNASYIHLACHGSQWAEDPNFGSNFGPPVVLNFGKSGISFKDILLKWDLQQTILITLSACDTGLVDFDRPWDEFEGLSHVIIQAGAKSTIGSLWSVDDESTALLMVRFYENVINSNRSLSKALCDAQLWLRNSTHASLTAEYPNLYKSYASDTTMASDARPFEHPYYWSPFFITGI